VTAISITIIKPTPRSMTYPITSGSPFEEYINEYIYNEVSSEIRFKMKGIVYCEE
jgi:hypothetical protein